MLDAFAIFYHDGEGFLDLELMRIEERGRKREMRIPASLYRLLPFGSFVSVDVNRLLHPITCDGLKPRHVLHLPALSSNYWPARDGGQYYRAPPDWRLRRIKISLLEIREMLRDSIYDANFRFWSLSISRFPPCFISPRKYRINFPSRHLSFKRPDPLPSVI